MPHGKSHSAIEGGELGRGSGDVFKGCVGGGRRGKRVRGGGDCFDTYLASLRLLVLD